MISEGSMITIDYTASIVNETENPRVFDTTILDIATKETIFKQGKVYEPMLVVIGKEWIPKGLENILVKAEVGEELEVIIPCDDAYGPKDPSKIKLVARREFQKQNINPSIGDRITIGSQEGSVLSVSATRVRMDYNHLLAGKDIKYSIKIHKIIEEKENQILSLINRRLPGADLSTIEVYIKDDIIQVIMPEQTRYYEYVQFAKAEIAKDIEELILGMKGINFIDHFPFL